MAPEPFDRTVVLTVVPRYVIVNKLQKNVAIKQYKPNLHDQERKERFAEATSKAVISDYQNRDLEADGALTSEFHFERATQGEAAA